MKNSNITILLKKIFFIFLISISFSAFVFSNEYKIMFLKGNIQDKIQAVEKSSASGDSSLAIEAFDFTLNNYSLFKDDEDVKSLMLISLDSICKNSDFIDSKQTAQTLGNAFKLFTQDDLRIKVLECMALFPLAENVSLINSFVSERMENATSMDDVLLSAIKCLKSIGNNTSFNILFIADILDVWPNYSNILADSYGNLINDCEQDVFRIMTTVPMDKKLVILRKIQKNNNISKKIRGEIAEIALSESIYNVGNSIEIEELQITLQLESLKMISETAWTRAADLATSYFSIAQSEYEKSLITENQFADCIKYICSVASSDTSKILSSYLETLNKRTEKNQIQSKIVVLSVIEALGGLGDKTAFDYLLYVTYLDYSEEITSAARKALAKLKW